MSGFFFLCGVGIASYVCAEWDVFFCTPTSFQVKRKFSGFFYTSISPGTVTRIIKHSKTERDDPTPQTDFSRIGQDGEGGSQLPIFALQFVVVSIL